jgi:hypothetical protein
MYEALKGILQPVLKLPSEPPSPPTGHAPGEFMKTVRAAPSYLNYRLFHWLLGVVVWTMLELVAVAVIMILFSWRAFCSRFR